MKTEGHVNSKRTTITVLSHRLGFLRRLQIWVLKSRPRGSTKVETTYNLHLRVVVVVIGVVVVVWHFYKWFQSDRWLSIQVFGAPPFPASCVFQPDTESTQTSRWFVTASDNAECMGNAWRFLFLLEGNDYILIFVVCCGNWMRPEAAGGVSEAELFFWPSRVIVFSGWMCETSQMFLVLSW